LLATTDSDARDNVLNTNKKKINDTYLS
jgi:hypothetical protein